VTDTSSVKAWLSPKEVGDIAGGFSAKFIRAEIKANVLPAIWAPSNGTKAKLGRYRIKREDAEAYVERLREKRDVPRGTRDLVVPMGPLGTTT
jgi:hypothetical protein